MRHFKAERHSFATRSKVYEDVAFTFNVMSITLERLFYRF